MLPLLPRLDHPDLKDDYLFSPSVSPGRVIRTNLICDRLSPPPLPLSLFLSPSPSLFGHTNELWHIYNVEISGHSLWTRTWYPHSWIKSFHELSSVHVMSIKSNILMHIPLQIFHISFLYEISTVSLNKTIFKSHWGWEYFDFSLIHYGFENIQLQLNNITKFLEKR